MTTCIVDNMGYCQRHQTAHKGTDLVIALRNDERAEQYRLLWDKQAAGIDIFQEYADQQQMQWEAISEVEEIRRKDGSPSTFQRVFNFGKALLNHAADGFQKRTKEEIEQILDKHCSKCTIQQGGFFDNGVCTHADCGCSVSREEVFFNKLAWRSEKCPIGKWPLPVVSVNETEQSEANVA